MEALKFNSNSKLKVLDVMYWETQYQNNNIGWDLGTISPAIKMYIDNLIDKKIAVLIPGCGNTYEAEYLLEQGFTNITVIDIAPTLVSSLQEKFSSNSNITILLGDFFEHKGQYNIIIEQTFFCALEPALRQKYAQKMNELLAADGILFGLLFNRQFDVGPPFGGSQEEYQIVFQKEFDILQMKLCLNSVAPRANTELFIELKKVNSLKDILSK
ncbi:MAG: methyltransferase domain-containing protein [Flavobacterium micromati]|nr:methyltransferase domain-containing protein [Flavobacterium micromati]